MQPAGGLNPIDWQPRKLAVEAAAAAATNEAKILGRSSWGISWSERANNWALGTTNIIIIIIRHTRQEEIPHVVETVVSTWEII